MSSGAEHGQTVEHSSIHLQRASMPDFDNEMHRTARQFDPDDLG